jgi:hypothetical protein
MKTLLTAFGALTVLVGGYAIIVPTLVSMASDLGVFLGFATGFVVIPYLLWLIWSLWSMTDDGVKFLAALEGIDQKDDHDAH